MRNIIFANRNKIEQNVLKMLNETQLMSANTLNSPRAVGDAVQSFLEQSITKCIPQNLTKNIDTQFARRAMADLAFEDNDENYYIVDIKTHNLETKFNMPNLTSVERLARFYGDRNNYFTLLLLSYKIVDKKLDFRECSFVPIENLDWSCLTIGALGWGQIQIANSNNIKIKEHTRKEWMLQLCDELDEFYPKEISKISERINYFKNIREFWEKQ
ncbi:MAG: hypothetical protein LBR17_03830 [Bacteroidales bacterium]|jgi:hypothetical protein|nr:hypothetical protein [Bacteroidales bacterium]